MHSVIIQSFSIHSCIQVSGLNASWALWWAPGKVQQNKHLSSPGPPLYQGEGTWMENGVWGDESCGAESVEWEGGCLDGKKVGSEPRRGR